MRYDRVIYFSIVEKVVINNYWIYNEQKEIKKANKSERWMPRLWEAMKDVISCDKLGVGANSH